MYCRQVCSVQQTGKESTGVLPADDPVQGLRTDVQGSFDVRVVQVEGGGGGVSAGGVQTDRQVERRQTS